LRDEEVRERDAACREEALWGGGEEFKRFAIDGKVDDGLLCGCASIAVAAAVGLLRFFVEALLF
jgi:hypothetical protein